uniref:Uncharacterized protein n=1 Tax=Nelumbo nucifera TaxID=4432 RepID=A0A822Z7D8_NELNU|nr:TPA_asm: hypothetical protein HUJ06_013642 [Nelumbo nucifera]
MTLFNKNDIDETNEGLMGEVGHDENGVENDLVFNDETLTWGDVTHASRVEEPIRNTKSRTSTSQLRATKINDKRPRQLQLKDEEEEEVDMEEEMEEDFGDYKLDDNGDKVELLSKGEDVDLVLKNGNVALDFNSFKFKLCVSLSMTLFLCKKKLQMTLFY